MTGRDGAYRLGLSPAGTYRVDFDLRGFDLIRRNHVRVHDDVTTKADAILPVSAMCECITVEEPTPLAERLGQVVDEAGWPLPYARIELVTSTRHEVSYADFEGRFLVRLPLDVAWLLRASDTGFHPLAQSVSGSTDEPVVFSLLARTGSTEAPDLERFDRGCRCGGDLFVHDDR